MNANETKVSVRVIESIMIGVEILNGIIFSFLASSFVRGAPQSKNSNDDVWAVLVAGSSDWFNYRHQADICHAYQLLLSKGVLEDKIITMMYDDIAYNPSNPDKGVIRNKPNGENVYEGVKIDYRQSDVNAKNFLNILSGNKSAMEGIGSGRVLESTSTSNVFINFVDHGGAGLLCFPDDILYADDLEKALHSLAIQNKFSKLLMYVDSCEAGSMFDNILEENLKILVSTASARDESSYGWYCTNGLCLGDLYSITWMEHMEQVSTNLFETIFHQYMVVRTSVTKSHVNLYGDFSIGFNVIKTGGLFRNVEFLQNSNKTRLDSGINNRDIPLHMVEFRALNAKDPENKKFYETKLVNIKKGRLLADQLMTSILEMVSEGNRTIQVDFEKKRYPLNKTIFNCYKQLVKQFTKDCYNVTKNTYFLQHLYKLSNLCAAGINTNMILKTFTSICNSFNNSIDEVIV